MSNRLLGRLRLALTGLVLACLFAVPVAASASSAKQPVAGPGKMPTPSIQPSVAATVAGADERFFAPRPARAPDHNAEDGASIDGEAAAQAMAAMSAAEPPVIHTPSNDRRLIGGSRPDAMFNRSLVLSSAGALVIASAGLIFLGACRRLW